MGHAADRQEGRPASQKTPLEKGQAEEVILEEIIVAEEIDKRIYTVPLRKTKRAPRTKRAPTAIRELKEFVTKHMKPEDDEGNVIKDFKIASKKNILNQTHKKIWIDEAVNRYIWKQGIEKPPSKVRIMVLKSEEGVVEINLAEE